MSDGSYTLFIFDRSAIARKFAENLGILRDCKTHLCCKDNQIVVFTGGALFEFQEASEYNRIYAQWNKDDLPLNINNLVKVPMEKQEAKIKIIGDLINKAGKVIHAGLPDADGQLSIDDLLKHCKCDKQIERFWSMRPFAQKTVQSGINSNYAAFAKTNSEISWRINENMRRAVSCMLNEAGVRINISYDYLAAAVLKMIIDREEQVNELNNSYYTIRALINGISVWSGAIAGEKDASSLCSLIKREHGSIKNYTLCDHIDGPPPLHNLTSMIIEAENRYDISAFEASEIANELYESGFISYPHVDCIHAPETMFQNAKNILSSLFGIEGAAQANPNLKSEYFSNNDQLGYHAIVPLQCAWQKLQGKKLKIFKIIAKRYIQQFYPEKRYKEQELSIEFGNKILSARGEIIDVAGWFDLSDDGSNEIPKFRKGDIVSSDIVDVQKAAISRFTIAEMLDAMSRIERFEINNEYRNILKENNIIGIGKDKIKILQFLKDRQYINIDNNYIVPTKTGKDFISWLPDKICSPALASIEEQRIYGLALNKTTCQQEESHANEIIDEWLSEINHINLENKKHSHICPKCQDVVSRIWSVDHYYWQCMNPNCNKQFTDYKGRCTMPEKCPKCGNKVAERHKRKDSDTYYWYCPDCKKYYDDNEGKIVPLVKCPVCEDVSCQRYESRNKPGVYYWHCKNKECGKRFADDDGKIGRKFPEDDEKAECPDCGGNAFRYESKNKPGEYYWRCKNCANFFTDENGKIGVNADKDKKQDKCPLCGGVALQYISANGNPYWRCKADKSHGPFSDEDGKPGTAFGESKTTGLATENCPHCKGKAYKTESKNKPGTFFWRCKNCGLMSDEDGKPGKIFSANK